MRQMINAGPVLAILATLSVLTTHRALAIPAPPPAVPEPSPVLAMAIGVAVLVFALFLKYFFQRRHASRQDS